MEKQVNSPLEVMLTDRVGVRHMIRIIDITHVPVMLCHDVRLHRAVAVATKVPSGGGGSMLVSM